MALLEAKRAKRAQHSMGAMEVGLEEEDVEETDVALLLLEERMMMEGAGRGPKAIITSTTTTITSSTSLATASSEHHRRLMRESEGGGRMKHSSPPHRLGSPPHRGSAAAAAASTSTTTCIRSPLSSHQPSSSAFDPLNDPSPPVLPPNASAALALLNPSELLSMTSADILKSDLLKSELLNSDLLRHELVKTELMRSELLKSELLASELIEETSDLLASDRRKLQEALARARDAKEDEARAKARAKARAAAEAEAAKRRRSSLGASPTTPPMDPIAGEKQAATAPFHSTPSLSLNVVMCRPSEEANPFSPLHLSRCRGYMEEEWDLTVHSLALFSGVIMIHGE